MEREEFIDSLIRQVEELCSDCTSHGIATPVWAQNLKYGLDIFKEDGEWVGDAYISRTEFWAHCVRRFEKGYDKIDLNSISAILYGCHAKTYDEAKALLNEQRGFNVHTPAGRLHIWAKYETDEDYDSPGVYIDLCRNESTDDDSLFACVEYDPHKDAVQACVYANPESEHPTHIITLGGDNDG